MALPPISVPTYPNVPNAPGVPALVRAAQGAVNQLTGTITGQVDALTSIVTGQVVGILAQATGLVSPIVGTLRGVIDPAGNLSGQLSGLIGGSVLGQVVGDINLTTGIISGNLTANVEQLTGRTTGLADVGDTTAEDAAEPFQWGIFDAGGSLVLAGDSVVVLEHMKEYRISTYPVEGGGFQSYNKVETPYDARITLTKGGTVAERTEFLAAVDALLASLDLFSILTPEESYLKANAVHRDLRRTAANGATLLTVEIGLTQVRDTAVATFVSTKTDSGAETVNAGPVQPQTPTPAQAVAIDSSLEGPPHP